MMYHVHKNGNGNYTVTDISGNMTREEVKARGKKTTKGWAIATLIVVGIIAFIVSSNFGIALIAGCIGGAISFVFNKIIELLFER